MSFTPQGGIMAGIFGSTVLDVAIGLVFVYLLLAIMCTSANEILAALTKSRQNLLKKGISQLLDNQSLSIAKDNTTGSGSVLPSSADQRSHARQQASCISACANVLRCPDRYVLGVPRVNLTEVYLITSHHGNDEVSVKLPYEMIIAAVLP
ncbi:MAG: hypothetical protein ABR555_04470 [Pyrinomonadaceae bacterium]